MGSRMGPGLVLSWLSMSSLDRLSAALLRARVSAQLTQEDLAREVGVRVGAVSRWERGITAPSPTTQQRLERLFPVVARAFRVHRRAALADIIRSRRAA